MLYGAALLAVPVPLSGPIGDGSANGRERGWFTTRGFHRPEVESSPSRHFSWTSGHAEIRVPNIDRTRPYRVSFRIRAGRSAATEPPPHLIVSVDAVPRLRTETSNARQDYAVEVPTDNRSTLVVAIDLSDTFVPGPGDRRELGVVVERVDIEPVDGRWRPTPYVALLAALATMAAAAVAVACGFPTVWTLVAGTLVSAVHVWLLTRDGAFLGNYADRLIHIAIGIAVAGAIVTVARRQWPAPVAAPDWSIAVGITLIAAALKIALFGHPNVALADSIFQVHRAQNVVAGQYFFTSITPRPFFEFPYAIALYVTALPLWDWFPVRLDRVRLLRGVTIAADALVGVAMYFRASPRVAGTWRRARVRLALAVRPLADERALHVEPDQFVRSRSLRRGDGAGCVDGRVGPSQPWGNRRGDRTSDGCLPLALQYGVGGRAARDDRRGVPHCRWLGRDETPRRVGARDGRDRGRGLVRRLLLPLPRRVSRDGGSRPGGRRRERRAVDGRAHRRQGRPVAEH